MMISHLYLRLMHSLLSVAWRESPTEKTFGLWVTGAPTVVYLCAQLRYSPLLKL